MLKLLGHLRANQLYVANSINTLFLAHSSKAMFSANQYTVALSGHVHPLMKHFFANGRGLYQNDNAQSIGWEERSLKGLISMK